MHIERLRADYKGAFDEWALQVSRRHKVSETTPDSLIMKEAEERVEVAQIAYRETRNRLAEKMVVGSTGTNTCLPISTT